MHSWVAEEPRAECNEYFWCNAEVNEDELMKRSGSYILTCSRVKLLLAVLDIHRIALTLFKLIPGD